MAPTRSVKLRVAQLWFKTTAAQKIVGNPISEYRIGSNLSYKTLKSGALHPKILGYICFEILVVLYLLLYPFHKNPKSLPQLTRMVVNQKRISAFRHILFWIATTSSIFARPCTKCTLYRSGNYWSCVSEKKMILPIAMDIGEWGHYFWGRVKIQWWDILDSHCSICQ